MRGIGRLKSNTGKGKETYRYMENRRHRGKEIYTLKKTRIQEIKGK